MVMPPIAKAKDLRQYAVVPILATKDPRITGTVLKTLVAFCAYADRMGRTFVGLERVAKDIGRSTATVHSHVRILYDLGYMANAKPLHRQQRSKSRRIIYTPKQMSEDYIRSTLTTADQMEIAEQEAVIKAYFRNRHRHNSEEERERDALRSRFVMLCEQYFDEARAQGWWISALSSRRAAFALGEQAQGCLRRDITALTAPSSHLGYLDNPDDD